MLESVNQRTYRQLIQRLPMRIQLTDTLERDLVQRGVTGSNPFEMRVAPRFRTNGEGVATLHSSPIAIPFRPSQSLVIVRDISRTGVGLISHQQWFPEQQYQVLLPESELLVKVVRIRFLGVRCFEIGCQLMRLREFISAGMQLK